MSEFCVINNFKTRPNADNGLWVLFLLPLSLIISTLKHPAVLTPTYKLTSLVSTGLFLTSLVITFQKYKNERLRTISIWTILVLLLTSAIFHIFLQKAWLFSVLSAVFSTLVYFRIYISVLKKFRHCFTLGEAGLVSQGIVIFLYSTIINFINAKDAIYKSNMQIATLIIQIGLLGIGTMSFTVYAFHIKSAKSFYVLLLAVIIFIIILPLHVLLQRSPVLWILRQVFSDLATIKLMIYWSFCAGIALLAVSNQIMYAQKASTGMRKVFHLLAVVVYVPGLLYKCSFLYLATGVVLGIFFFLEILRLLNIPPLGLHLQDGFVVYSDEKDAGNLALTPIYLLVACSLPTWIHPSPCDVTDSSMFNLIPLLSGLLSIGIGDTAASVVGSTYGRFYWPGSKKTIEGTVACILAQVSVIYLLVNLGAMEPLTAEETLRLYLAILVASVTEARTTQVDNLVLPLIMYIMLI